MSGSQDREQLKYNVSHHLCRAVQFIISKPDTKLRNRNMFPSQGEQLKSDDYIVYGETASEWPSWENTPLT